MTHRAVETPDRYNRGVVIIEIDDLDSEGNQITIVQNFTRNFNVDIVAANRQFGYYPATVEQEFCNHCGTPGNHRGLNWEMGLCQGCYDELLDAPLPSDEFGHYVHPAYALDTPSERPTYYQGGF